ncbi:MAG: 4Fe-4S dicluster domain-containing protein [Acidimicrobiia bacterium]
MTWQNALITAGIVVAVLVVIWAIWKLSGARMSFASTTATTPPLGALSHREAALRKVFLEEVDRIPGGDRIRRCIQCGTCSGSCPVSHAMDIQPRELVGLFRAGDLDSIMRSRTIWICASCYSCTVRCPSGIKVTDLIYALKRMAIADGVGGPGKAISPLAKNFVKIVKRTGRNHELELMARYLLRRAPLRIFSMMPMGWKLLRTGRLALWPKKIKGIEGLQKIIAKAETMDHFYPKQLSEHMGDIGYGVVTERSLVTSKGGNP